MSQTLAGSNDRPGYQFMGWYLDEAGTKRLNPGGVLPKVVTLHEKWAPVWYKVNYETGPGENDETNPKLVSIESDAIRLKPAFLKGKIFDGWSYNGKRITHLPQGVCHPITIRAHWRNPYAIHFDTAGGAKLESMRAGEDDKLPSLPTPRKLGYHFDGWYMDHDLQTPVPDPGIVTRDVVLHAKWRPEIYQISYDLDGGINARRNPKTYTYLDEDIIIQNPTRAGYTFVGWEDPRGNSTDMIPSRSIGNKSFKAIWKKHDEHQ